MRSRQSELRQLSHQLIEGEPLYDIDALRSAYQRLEEVRDLLLDSHMSEGSSTSVGDTGIDSDLTTALNNALDAGMSIDEEARLEEILNQMHSTG